MAATPTLVDSDVGNESVDTTIVCTVDVSGTNRLAIVLIGQRTLNTVVSVTFGSDELAEFGSIYNDDDSAVHIWYLKQPTVNSGVTVTITFSGSMTESCSAWVGSFSGVDQTTPLGTYVSAIEDGTDPHNFTVTAVTNDYCLAAIQAEYGVPIGITSGNTATELYSYDNGSYHSFFAYKISTSGNFEFSFDVGTSTHTAYNGVSVKGLAATYKLEGITYDKTGSVLVSCECYLFKDNQDNSLTYVGYDESDGVTGAYSFTGIADNDSQYIVVAWKDDSPHVFDVTDYVLQPVLE